MRLAVIAFGLAALIISPAQAGKPVVAPDWRDQILYFAVTDRFADGDPSNNDQGAGVYDPADGAKYSGGDLAGVRQRLDYIEGLGVTGVWLTPPVRNQWWDDEVKFSGYHGYWASDFSAIDPHYGTEAEYRALAEALHDRDMTLVQDIVVNHVGNYFTFDRWSAEAPTQGWRQTLGSRPDERPVQWPFSQNNPNDPSQRSLAIYHWTPRINDHADEVQERTYQLADLDDLNTESPVVRRALRKTYGDWIRRVGVDAFRVDTAFYVPPEFFVDFLHADDKEAPGVLRVAQAAGKPTFHVFGEGFGIDAPFADHQMRKIDAYQRLPNGIPAMIQFPLHATLTDVFGRGHAPRELAWRIERTLAIHADPWRMPSFVDNHDVERFLASGGEAGLQQALLSILTLPGIPVIYYGTEQGLRGQRDAMFANGFGSGGRDRFDTTSAGYQSLQRMIALRLAEPALRRGRPTLHAANGAGPGALAWAMHDGHSTLLMAMNSADGEALLDASGLPANARLQPLFAIDGQAPALTVDPQGRLLTPLPARAGWVWRVIATTAAEAATATPSTALSIDALVDTPVSGPLALTGGAAPRQRGLRLVVNGDLAGAQAITVDAAGRWRARLRTDDFLDANTMHTVLVYDPATGLASAAQSFRVQPNWQPIARAEDPAGDDAGPRGRYRYPQDRSYGREHSMDLRAARLFAAGGALAIEIEMAELLATWGPANGFDHVAFNLFLNVPGLSDAATVMPGLNGSLPDGQRWQRRLRVGGWSAALFDAEGASPDHDGEAMAPGPRVSVDHTRKVIRIELPASALGYPTTLEGLNVHVTTWDYDAGWKALTPEGGNHTFGGGDGRRDPLWMDAMTVTVP